MYDWWLWGVVAVVAMAASGDDIETDIGDDARNVAAGKGNRQNVRGDDRHINIVNNPEQRRNTDRHKEEEEDAEWQTLIYGNDRMNYPGILNRIHALESENNLFRIGGVVIMILIGSLFIALAIAIRAWGG